MKRIVPTAGQESVWDYPRPPRLEFSPRSVRIVHAGVTIAASTKAYRVLETSHPPTWYLPQGDIAMDYLRPAAGSSFCEWKGRARYWDLLVHDQLTRKVAWSYPEPSREFLPIRDHLAFYPSRVDSCFVNEELVQAQDGDFYGGWITSEIVGPFKGGAGTWGW